MALLVRVDAARADVREGRAWSSPQRVKNDVIHALVVVALAVVARLPRRIIVALGRTLGRIAWLVLGRERRRVGARLARGLRRGIAPREVRAVFVRAGELLADTLVLLSPVERASSTLTMDATSAEVFREALRGGRGVVFITAHLGPWERMAAVLVEAGFPVATVARESYDPRFTALYERLRAPRGVRSIYRGAPGAGRAIARELARGGAVGFLVDLPGRAPSFRAPLFGGTWRVARGAVRFALARGAALVVGAPAPSERGLVVRIDRISKDLCTEDEATAAVVSALDARIREDPAAWVGLLAPPGADADETAQR